MAQSFATPHTPPFILSAFVSTHAGSADLESMFCPQDDPFTCTGTYTVQQDDMDAGSYNTTSHVTAVSPNGTTIVDETHSSATLLGAAGVSVGERALSYCKDA